MSTVVLVARCAVAAIFAVAGGAKLLDASGSREAFRMLGIPTRFVVPGAVLLPWAELTTAVLVLVPATAWWGGLAAFCLLVAFTVVVAVNLGAGRAPDCRCFGRLAPSPIGPATLLRNALFAVPALVVVLFA